MDMRSRLKLGAQDIDVDAEQLTDEQLQTRVEPWLSAVLGSEHLSLLVGNGLPTAVLAAAGGHAASMASGPIEGPDFAEEVEDAAARGAKATGRRSPNLEDRIRAALTLTAGMEVIDPALAKEWTTAIDGLLSALVADVLQAERWLRDGPPPPSLEEGGEDAGGVPKADDMEGQEANPFLDAPAAEASQPPAAEEGASEAAEEGEQEPDPRETWRHGRQLLERFLLSMASRPPSRDRLHVFTTNYDRLIEWACDRAALRPLDRFIGGLEPVFRASRLDVDLHYNPPGIRGEPRYLEGVLRLTKLHGSLDWQWREDDLVRVPLPFGAQPDHPSLLRSPTDGLIVYPSPAKDVETGLYPYAELFRDLSAALCRPNASLITYGYGFGDEHINRVLRDMLNIPSTHLVVISWDDCQGRLESFLKRVGHPPSVSVLMGPRLADLGFLVEWLLPRPGEDALVERLEQRRARRGDRTEAPAPVIPRDERGEGE